MCFQLSVLPILAAFSMAVVCGLIFNVAATSCKTKATQAFSAFVFALGVFFLFVCLCEMSRRYSEKSFRSATTTTTTAAAANEAEATALIYTS